MKASEGRLGRVFMMRLEAVAKLEGETALQYPAAIVGKPGQHTLERDTLLEPLGGDSGS